jgi:hypothetical protein
MEKEKRKKTKMIQIRVTPENYKIYDNYASSKNLSKTKLFEKILEEIIKKDLI